MAEKNIAFLNNSGDRSFVGCDFNCASSTQITVLHLAFHMVTPLIFCLNLFARRNKYARGFLGVRVVVGVAVRFNITVVFSLPCSWFNFRYFTINTISPRVLYYLNLASLHGAASQSFSCATYKEAIQCDWLHRYSGWDEAEPRRIPGRLKLPHIRSTFDRVMDTGVYRKLSLMV